MIHEPANLTAEQKCEIIRVHEYIAKGGWVSCGHTFWADVKLIPYGDIVLCMQCMQYFVKAKDLPWWIKGQHDNSPKGKPPRHNHLGDHVRQGFKEIEPDIWMYPITIRLQDPHGNTIMG